MSRAGTILARDIRLGPRSPLLLWALVLPVVITLLVRLVFGELFATTPELGIVDPGDSQVTAAALALEGVEVTVVDDEESLLRLLEDGDLDAGLVLPADFDETLDAGGEPDLTFLVGGSSLASNRVILAATILDLVRDAAGREAPLSVDVISAGETSLEIETRMIPLMVVLVVAVAGAMLPALSLVEERERHTLDAVLVTPASIRDVMVAKGLLGILTGSLVGVVVLALNGVLDTGPVLLVAAVLVGAVMMAEFGLALGSWARDSNTLFTVWKAGAIVLIFPVVFFIWDGFPEWVARLGPTFYFLRPMFAVAVEGAGAGDVWLDLVIAAGICVLLVPAVAAMARRLERTLATSN